MGVRGRLRLPEPGARPDSAAGAEEEATGSARSAGPDAGSARAGWPGRLGRRARLSRGLLAALVTAAVVVPISAAAAHPEIPAPAPARLTAVPPANLDEAYAANRANAAEAARMAADHGDHGRAAAVRSMADPDRHFLSFDARGSGRAVEIFGDLAKAERVAVLVPGSDTNLDTYERFRAGADALHKRLGIRGAVVAWLGYETPGTMSPEVLTTGRATDAAPELRDFIRELEALNPRAQVSLLCHSYGTVVCAEAAESAFRAAGSVRSVGSVGSAESASSSGAAGAARAARAASGESGESGEGGEGGEGDLDVSDIALFGSPGTGADSVAGLHTDARVWAGRGAGDWIADIPHAKADLFGTTVGFGTDPVSPDFGARVFAAGEGGHSDYLKPGSVSLDNLARIVLGETSEVTRA
ncbi:alpha/beta hydrolase [Streptomyces sp. NPDC006365]|uniref:alpha/beta hydrolase n=1 Tax=Streptomyces sp. NPDC006365 TaxID=3364744 RepID=UPI003689BF5C